MLNIFEVGGCVRDEILGVSTNDIDFTFVIDDTNQTVDEGWEQMLSHLKEAGFKIFLEQKNVLLLELSSLKTTLMKVW